MQEEFFLKKKEKQKCYILTLLSLLFWPLKFLILSLLKWTPRESPPMRERQTSNMTLSVVIVHLLMKLLIKGNEKTNFLT